MRRVSPRKRPTLDQKGEGSLTKQQFKDECDYNVLMGRYAKHGVIPQRRFGGFYGDFDSQEEFMDVTLRVQAAHEDFMGLPSDVRERFGNDPGQLINFISDPSNIAEAISLGLIEGPEMEQAEPAPQEVAAAATDEAGEAD